MAERRRTSTARGFAAAWLCAAALAGGCAAVTDDSPLPGPSGPPGVVATEPVEGATDVPRRPVLLVRFDRYLDPFGVAPRTALRLTSGDRRIGLDVRYDAIDRALHARPTSRLAPGIRYTLAFADTLTLPDFAGRTPEEESLELRFLTGPDDGDAPPAHEGDAEVAAVEALDRAGCLQCHAAGAEYPGTDLALSDLAAVVGRPARTAADRRIVDPGAPGRSYLLHKLLPDYPDRVGAPMPLTFDRDGEPTTPSLGEEARRDLARTLARWIAALPAER